MSVDLPSSTEPQVLKRRISIGMGETSEHIRNILAFLRSSIAASLDFVVGARAALGHAGGGDLGDDVIHGVGRAFDEAGADDVADGAHADDEFLHFLFRLRRQECRVTGQPLAAAAHRTGACGEK